MASILDIIVKDVEKRKSPSKHYAYVMEVQWSDGSTVKIGRRYSDFFDLQMTLLEQFPEEAGQKDPMQRIIPFLPGKTLFRRSNTREFALKRMVPISEYCTGIVKMPRFLSESELILDFFRQSSEDRLIKKWGNGSSPEKTPRKSTADSITGPLILDKYVAVADYTKDNKKELSLKSGEVVEVVEKSENGWWLAANEEGMNGWVPAVYLESLYGDRMSPTKERARPGEGDMFKAILDYTATSEDELTFVTDDLMEVLEKNLEGWWWARKDGFEGWVPATYLEESNSSSPEISPSHNEQFGGFRQRSAERTKRPPPKRSTVRRTLTRAAVAKVQVDFKAKMMMKQDSITEEEDEDEEFAGEYITIGAFQATIQDGLSFDINEIVHVIQKSNAGWWYGRIGDKRGWVPETYLTAAETSPPIKPLGLPLPMPLGGKSRTPDSPAKTFGSSGTSGIPKSSKPQRPPAPMIKSNAAKQAAKTFGANRTSPAKTQQPPKTETRSPLSPLPALPQYRGMFPHSPIKNSSPKIKDLSDYLWYRNVSRQEAEEALLCEGEEGYFIIRPSQRGSKQEKPYSLTLYHQNQNWNFHIRLRTDMKYAVGIYKETEACFSDLPSLVEYYTEYPLVIGDEERKVKLVDSPQELYHAC